MGSSLKQTIKEAPDQKKLRKKRHSKILILSIVSGFVFLCLIVGLIFVARDSKILIKNIIVTGNQIIDTDTITAKVEEDLSGNYGYIIPKRNAYVYPKEKILTDLKYTFPRFNSVLVYRTNNTTLEVDVNETRGTALWCGASSNSLNMNSGCYFTDAHGVIIDQAPYYSGTMFLRFFGGDIDASSTNLLGKSFVDEGQFNKLLDLCKAFSSLGFSIMAVRIGPGNENDFVLGGETQGALIRFTSSNDYSLVLANLKAALTRKELSDQLVKDRINLQYFDLRFADKVYYKFVDSQD